MGQYLIGKSGNTYYYYYFKKMIDSDVIKLLIGLELREMNKTLLLFYNLIMKTPSVNWFSMRMKRMMKVVRILAQL